MEAINISVNITTVITSVIASVVAGVVALYIQKSLDKKGELLIYFRRINVSNTKGWGFVQNCLLIPLYVDLLNTSNTNKVVRDFSLYLYDDKKEVEKLVQTTMAGNDENKGVKTYGIVNDRYSFLVEGKSIVTAECLYMLKMQELDKGANYDRIIVRYYDENNKKHECELMKLEPNKKSNQLFEIDKDWIQLK